MIAALLLAAAVAVPSPPAPSEYVTDTQGVLSAQTVQTLDAELAAYEHATGHQIVVYIGSTTGDESLEQWTVDTAQRWGIGRKGHDDGAVLFLLMHDRKIRIEVGYGLEPELTDAQAFWIVENDIEPEMRAGDVNAAVQSGVDHMLTTITPSFASQIGHPIAGPEPGSAGESSGLSGAAIWLVIFLCFFWIVIVFAFVAGIRYLVALFTKGPAAAAKAWHDTWIASGTRHGNMFWGGGPFLFGGGFGGGGFGGGFSGGGGGFGGGGASGGW